MMIFETGRLYIKKLRVEDKASFIELQTNPKIIDSGPHQNKSVEEVLRNFELNLESETGPKKYQDNIWGVFEKGKSEMIGIVALLTNNQGDWELGYRFKVKYWGLGLGTELAKGMVKYCFEVLEFDKITADVDVENVASVKILDKIMERIEEFYNEEDRCLDRRYEIRRKNWLQRKCSRRLW